jgi:pimeloyl-ACP methyl ester carboxylesterase
MLHGSHTDHHELMYSLEPLFETRTGWRRIYPDLPGRGKTPGADWINSQDDILAVILDFLDGIAPGERVVVAGYSLGAYLAQGVAYKRGEQMDGLMLGAPAIAVDPAKRNYPPHQVLVQDPEFAAAVQPEEQMLLQVAVVQSPQRLAAFRAAIKPGLMVADRDFIARVAVNGRFSFDVNSLPTPFPAPTLIVTGKQDSICGYREAWSILDNYPRGTFAVLDRAGHGLSEEQKGLYRALATEWLNRVEEYAPSASTPNP